MFPVLIMLGLTLLLVHWVIVIWLVGEYEARIRALEAQLLTPCPGCQAVAQGAAWGHASTPRAARLQPVVPLPGGERSSGCEGHGTIVVHEAVDGGRHAL
jgi:hypothetical protein